MGYSLYVAWFLGECALVLTLFGIVRLAWPSGSNRFECIEVALSVLLALVCLVATPAFVGEFRISPDSLEYVAGARALIESGRFVLPYGDLIPRYPPWFSAGWIAPFLLGGGDVGWAIVPVTLAGLLAVLCGYRIGLTVGGAWGGMLSALLLLLVPGFVFFSRQVLIDIPTTLLALGGALVWMRLSDRSGSPRFLPLLGGAIVAWGLLLRPTGIVLALPLALQIVRRSEGRVRALGLFLAPIFGALALGFGYNRAVFGEFLRNGYHYWCAVPYDFAALTFGTRYIAGNLAATFLDSGLGALIFFVCIGGVVLQRGGIALTAELRSLGGYVLIVGIPLVAFYLLYFFPAVRFIVPVASLVAVFLGGMIGLGVQTRAPASRFRRFGLGGAIFIVAAYRLVVPELPAVKRGAVDLIRAYTPAGAIVISGIDPVYLSLMAGGDREYLPVSRRVEYASKVITPRKLTIDPEGLEPRCDNPDPRVLAHGSSRAVARVALEDPLYISTALAEGRPVFLEMSRLRDREVAMIEERFSLVERAPRFFELSVKSSSP